VLAQPSARAYAHLCGAIGVGTAAIHVAFAAAGRDEFRLPLSIATLGACLIAGAGLLLSSRKQSTG